MKLVLVSQRVVVDAATGERRDALDQAWHPFLERCGLVALPIPNVPAAAARLLEIPHVGLLLTGGNDLACVGGDAPERDSVESMLLAHALEQRMPVLGVCRGMQFLLARNGQAPERVEGHAGTEHALDGDQGWRTVRSFHQFGFRSAPEAFEVCARASDGVIEAVRHRKIPLRGIMWHPEREPRAWGHDVLLFRDHFASGIAR